LEEKGLQEENGAIAAANERKTYLAIANRLHSSIIAEIPNTIKTGSDLIKHLLRTRSGGNVYELKKKYREYTMLPHQQDAYAYLIALDKIELEINQAGGLVSAEDKYIKMTDDLNQTLYQFFIADTRVKCMNGETKVDDAGVEKIRKNLEDYSKSLPKIKRAAEIREVARLIKFEKRLCTICEKKYGDRKVKGRQIKICETHNTEDHVEPKEANKSSENYILLDSCASTHLVPIRLDTNTTGLV